MTNKQTDDPADADHGTDSTRKTVAIVNSRGLHARASAKFVKVAVRFDADITVAKDGTAVCGTSIMGLMMLAAGLKQHIEISAVGPQAAEAVETLARLVANKFDED